MGRWDKKANARLHDSTNARLSDGVNQEPGTRNQQSATRNQERETSNQKERERYCWITGTRHFGTFHPAPGMWYPAQNSRGGGNKKNRLLRDGF